MATKHIADAEGDFTISNVTPDFCKVGKDVIPFDISRTLKPENANYAKSVFARGEKTLTIQSIIAGVDGNAGKGVKSGVSLGDGNSQVQEGSGSVFIEGKKAARHGDEVEMNGVFAPGLSREEEKKKAKKERYDCRKSQIEAGKQSEDPQAKEAAGRFEKNNQAIEKANLSAHVYDKDKELPPGWKKATEEDLAKMGLKPEDLSIDKSDFRAEVYMPDKEVFGKDMKPTLAFKGTSSMEDWKNNGLQAMDMESSYYRKAVQLGDKLAGSNVPVEITGHSLGGGMASAASVSGGKAATTFNAAGLHANTVGRYGGTPQSSPVQAYRVAGEMLTGIQEPGLKAFGGAAAVGGPVGVAAVGALGAMTPKAIGEPHELPGSAIDPVRRHFMTDVIDGIEAQKEEDQATLSKATGVTCSK